MCTFNETGVLTCSSSALLKSIECLNGIEDSTSNMEFGYPWL